MRISVTKLRGNIFKYFERLDRTGDIEIEHKGKVVAKIVKVKKED